MAEFYDIVKCLFSDRKNYKNISDEDKEANFFIINRYMCKRYPEKAQKFNHKDIDKSLALDNWFIDDNIRKSNYSNWFWAKGKESKEKPIIPNKDRNLLINHFSISDEDLDFLLIHFLKDVKEELSHLNKIIKEHKK